MGGPLPVLVGAHGGAPIPFPVLAAREMEMELRVR